MEKDIEKMMRKKIEQMGGQFLKFTSPGNNGVPDRIAILPGGRIWFVELKDDGGQVRKIQERWKRELCDLGCRAVIIEGEQQAKEWLAEREAEWSSSLIHISEKR